MSGPENNRGWRTEKRSDRKPAWHLKREIEDALMLRGSRNFDTLEAYRRFVEEMRPAQCSQPQAAWISRARGCNRCRRTPDDGLRTDDRHHHLRPRVHPKEGVYIRCPPF